MRELIEKHNVEPTASGEVSFGQKSCLAYAVYPLPIFYFATFTSYCSNFFQVGYGLRTFLLVLSSFITLQSGLQPVHMAAMLGFADLLKYITSLPGVDATAGSTEVSILFHYDVIGGKVGTKWRKYLKTCMFYT